MRLHGIQYSEIGNFLKKIKVGRYDADVSIMIKIYLFLYLSTGNRILQGTAILNELIDVYTGEAVDEATVFENGAKRGRILRLLKDNSIKMYVFEDVDFISDKDRSPEASR